MTTRWSNIEPASAGFSAGMVEGLDALGLGGNAPNIHAVLLSRRGELVLERYFAGEDQQIGKGSLGTIVFAGDTLHDLRSVTKSIVGLLFGIALERGQVPGLDTPLVDCFPEYPDFVAAPDRRRITIAHALDMTMGLEWDESLPYTDPRNAEIAMEYAADRYRFALSQPIVASPGARWIYSGGAVALLGAVIERGTGQSLPDFARDTLFLPLGIERSEWFAGADGAFSAAAGLRLGALDLLRIGDMLAARGTYQGRSIVLPAWLQQSWTARTRTSWDQDYGHLWYLGRPHCPAYAQGTFSAAGFGNGGQRLFVLPEAGIACVILAGRYDMPGAEQVPDQIWHDIILPSVVVRQGEA